MLDVDAGPEGTLEEGAAEEAGAEATAAAATGAGAEEAVSEEADESTMRGAELTTGGIIAVVAFGAAAASVVSVDSGLAPALAAESTVWLLSELALQFLRRWPDSPQL